MTETEIVILLVEDEAAIRQLICLGLEAHNYTFIEAADLDSAEAALAQQTPDLIILDWMLPDGNGIALLQSLRQSDSQSNLPILMLTARTAEPDIVKALDLGADDHLSKPFSINELHSRIKALLRRSNAPRHTINELNWHNIRIDLQTHQVYFQNQNVKLHRREYNLLTAFVRQPGKVYSREQLLNLAWGEQNDVGDRAVDVAIRRLRKAFEKYDYALPIATMRGVGYRLNKHQP